MVYDHGYCTLKLVCVRRGRMESKTRKITGFQIVASPNFQACKMSGHCENKILILLIHNEFLWSLVYLQNKHLILEHDNAVS